MTTANTANNGWMSQVRPGPGSGSEVDYTI